jgi:predicted N-formylglutamate amidohydrolase
MIAAEDRPLLGPDDPPPYSIERGAGASPVLLICDHAGGALPRSLGDLGVSAADLQRHIAWDIGAAEVACLLAAELDACLIRQTYSRLVIDCNRPLDAPGSIVSRSEDTDIPGNAGLDAASARRRAREVFEPYHDRIAAELDRRAAAGRATILVSVHSFTPVYRGVARPWQLGTLYGSDSRVARRLLALVRGEGWVIGDNEPYAVSATTDYAIPVHGDRRGLPNIGLEIRQDLIAEARGQAEWARRIAAWLATVASELAAG